MNLADTLVQSRLAHVIRESVREKVLTPAQWADIFRYVTGTVTPVMQMREGVAQKILDFYEVENHRERSLN